MRWILSESVGVSHAWPTSSAIFLHWCTAPCWTVNEPGAKLPFWITAGADETGPRVFDWGLVLYYLHLAGPPPLSHVHQLIWVVLTGYLQPTWYTANLPSSFLYSPTVNYSIAWLIPADSSISPFATLTTQSYNNDLSGASIPQADTSELYKDDGATCDCFNPECSVYESIYCNITHSKGYVMVTGQSLGS